MQSNENTSNFEPRPFGKYFLTDRIAVGGMAEIYKAKTFGVDGFEKTLAIKKILGHCSSDKEFITMLTDEAKLVVNLSHTNIVQVYDLGRVASDYFISMEFIDGVNLRELMVRGHERKDPPSLEICLFILSEVCKGLDYAHSKSDSVGNPLGIVHRDISPQNILVSFEGEVKIVDFGIAKAAMNMSQTNVGTLKGKVTYMSPEQALGRPIDHRTDIFSCGIILYELLTGKRLFRGENQLEVLEKIRSTRITLASIPESIPEEVRNILARALAYNANDRYPSAADMQIDLTRILYSRFRDFSPRRLSEIMNRYFSGEITSRRKAEIASQSSEATARQNLAMQQVNIVHREVSAKSRSGINLPALMPDGGGHGADSRELSARPVEHSKSVAQRSQLSRSLSRQHSQSSALGLWQGASRRKKIAMTLSGVGTLLLLVLLVIYFARLDNQIDIESGDLITSVDIISKPSGAKVFLDGTDTKMTTPCLIEKVVIGRKYKLRLVKDGFKSHDAEVLVEDETVPPLSFQLTATDSARYQLTIKTQPSGASIFWDGKKTDLITPADLTDLEVGKNYPLEIKLPGYKEYSRVFVNDGAKDQILDVKLSPKNLEKLIIKSVPAGAQIFIKGVDTGQVTPHEFTHLILPQTWDLQLRKDGYEDLNTRLEITDGPEKTFAYSLKKKNDQTKSVPMATVTATAQATSTSSAQATGTTVAPTITNNQVNTQVFAHLRIDSVPSGASVRINGVAQGFTPIQIGELKKNESLQIVLTKQGYRRWQTVLTLNKDLTELAAKLEKEEL